MVGNSCYKQTLLTTGAIFMPFDNWVYSRAEALHLRTVGVWRTLLRQNLEVWKCLLDILYLYLGNTFAEVHHLGKTTVLPNLLLHIRMITC